MLDSRRITLIVVCMSLVALGGCAAKLSVRRIPREAASQAKGLVVQTNVPHDIVAIFPKSLGNLALDTEDARAMLPSPKDYYELNYCGALFRSAELKVELHPDTTIKKVEMNSNLQLADQLGAVTSSLGEISSVKKEIEAAEPSEDQEKAAEAARLKNEVLIRMQQANRDALDLGQPLPYPDIAK